MSRRVCACPPAAAPLGCDVLMCATPHLSPPYARMLLRFLPRHPPRLACPVSLFFPLHSDPLPSKEDSSVARRCARSLTRCPLLLKRRCMRMQMLPVACSECDCVQVHTHRTRSYQCEVARLSLSLSVSLLLSRSASRSNLLILCLYLLLAPDRRARLQERSSVCM